MVWISFGEYIKMKTTNKIDIKNLSDDEIDLENLSEDEIMKLLGACCLHGTNTEYINKQIKILEGKKERTVDDNKQLIKYYNELGRDNNGNKKPSVCWNYVMNGKCNHLQINSLEKGIKLNNLWHPAKEEKEYLQKKKNVKTINH